MQVCASDGARSRPQLPAADETAGMPEEGSTSFGWQSKTFKDNQEDLVEKPTSSKVAVLEVDIHGRPGQRTCAMPPARRRIRARRTSPSGYGRANAPAPHPGSRPALAPPNHTLRRSCGWWWAKLFGGKIAQGLRLSQNGHIDKHVCIRIRTYIRTYDLKILTF